MENSFREENKSIFNLQVDETSKAYMLETARWTKFIGIVYIIFMALYLLVMMFAGAAFTTMSSSYGGSSAMAGMGAAGMIVMALVVVAFVIYPILCLMRYSKNMKEGLLNANQEQFNMANANMKGLFKYTGIVLIVFLGLYALVFLFAGLGAMM